ncbi:MAG: hypothetical protein WC207_02235 [Sphaerochaetaceae bacterium]|nr:hypothetical protein [Sphaerochaetaceae bacterium]
MIYLLRAWHSDVPSSFPAMSSSPIMDGWFLREASRVFFFD